MSLNPLSGSKFILMKKTAESKVAKTILQETKTIEVGGKTYEVAPPSIATLIKVSELVSQMPHVNAETEDPVTETLSVAKGCGVISDILAVMILGAKKTKGRRIWPFSRKSTDFNELSESLLHEKTPRELSGMLTDLLINRMDIGFFFGITTSLGGVNVTKPTKTTASGQQ